MSFAACLALLAALAQAPAPIDRAAIEAALVRAPATLPRATAGRWTAWKPSDPIAEECRAQFAAALAAYQDADYGGALAGLHACLERVPDLPAGLYQCGSTYFRLRRYGDARTMLERFLETVPAEVGATQALGHSLYSLGEYVAARAHYERVVAANASSVEAWRGLGLANLRLGEAKRALECLDRALELRADHADALIWRAQALLDLERPGEALLAIGRGLELAAFDPHAWFVAAQIHAALDQGEAAERARARFLELNRIEQEVRTQEGLLLHDARALEPLMRLVVLHRSAGNRAEAKAAMLRCLRVAPGELRVHALALETFVDPADAALADRTVTEIETRFAGEPAAWELLERYHRARGDFAPAEAAARRAAELAKRPGR
jgi:tetratricopeptide (TPR) repeat protein